MTILYTEKNVYYALVQSKLEYGIVCWGGVYEFVFKKIFKINPKCLVLANMPYKKSFYRSRDWTLSYYKVKELFYCRRKQ